jgi:hypothetical protein
MGEILTLIKELITIALVGETEASSAEVQLAGDSQPGYRRNVVAAVSPMWDCRISQDISEISLMPQKTSLPKARQSSFGFAQDRLNSEADLSNSR